MCNLFANTLPQAAMRSLFAVAPEDDRLGNLAPLRAIFPRGDAPVLRAGQGGRRELVAMHWGFVLPQVSKRTGAPIQPKAVNNARDDKLLASSFWRESLIARRCLLPATSFSEAQGRSPAIIHWFGVLDEDGRSPAPFAFAAIWRRWRGLYRDEPREIDTVSMVTTTPNDLVRPVHPDRMPAILPPQDWAAWLGASPEEALALIRPYPAERMSVIGRGAGLKSEPEEARAGG